MLVQVEVASFAVDPSQNMPLVILKEKGGKRTIPIVVGSVEASAIAIKSMDVASMRPLTIDLVMIIMRELGGTLRRVVIYDLVDQVFLARLQVSTSTGVHVIECRPSDGISLALRSDSRIFVEDVVFEKNESVDSLSEAELLRKNIVGVDTLEFGRYYLD